MADTSGASNNHHLVDDGAMSVIFCLNSVSSDSRLSKVETRVANLPLGIERELYRFVHQSTLFVCCEVEDNIISMQLCHWCLLRLGIKLVLTVKQRICLVE